jgi:hypothetical protein
LHAWGDSNLYLRQLDDRLLLSIEHRAAPSRTGLPLALRGPEGAVGLHLVDTTVVTPRDDAPPSPIARVEDVLLHSDRPVSLTELRQACRMRTARLRSSTARRKRKRLMTLVFRIVRDDPTDAPRLRGG